MEAYGSESKEAERWRNEAKEYFSRYALNFECISPVDYYRYGSHLHKTDTEVFRFDLRKVKEADIILVNLHNIRKSLGTNDEILYAYLNGKPVIGFIETENELNGEEIIELIHPWKYIQIDRIETGRDAMLKAMEYIKDYYF